MLLLVAIISLSFFLSYGYGEGSEQSPFLSLVTLPRCPHCSQDALQNESVLPMHVKVCAVGAPGICMPWQKLCILPTLAPLVISPRHRLSPPTDSSFVSCLFISLFIQQMLGGALWCMPSWHRSMGRRSCSVPPPVHSRWREAQKGKQTTQHVPGSVTVTPKGLC